MHKYSKILLSLYLLFNYKIIAAQSNITNDAKADTSFTVYSAYAKVIKDFPNARIVTPNKNLEVNSYLNLVYINYGQRKMHLDLFWPKLNSTSYPGVILVHGGGWHSGNKSNLVAMAIDLASKGYVAAAVEYRLSDEAIYPAAVIDIKASIKWMKTNAVEYNLDTSMIAILGCSAGAQLASLVGFSNGEEKYEPAEFLPEVTSNVQAVVNIDGLLDFTSPESKEFDTDPNKPRSAHIWFGSSFNDNPDLWRDGSAYYHIDKNDIPIIFINSSLPHYHAGRDATIAKLKEYKIDYDVYTIENTPHTFWLFYPWYPETLNYVEGFLKKTFNPLK